MENPAAFGAEYSDFKLIKTRGVIQICFEVPLEKADHAYQVLGGMPDASKSAWFGIAKLQKADAVRTEQITPQQELPG